MILEKLKNLMSKFFFDQKISDSENFFDIFENLRFQNSKILKMSKFKILEMSFFFRNLRFFDRKKF